MTEHPTFFNQRLPARIGVEGTSKRLGFAPYEIPILVKARLLKPLGKPSQNSRRWFATVEIEQLAQDREWLDKATRVIAEHFHEKSEKILKTAGQLAV
jgi:hypothetical protein